VVRFSSPAGLEGIWGEASRTGGGDRGRAALGPGNGGGGRARSEWGEDGHGVVGRRGRKRRRPSRAQ
jgi:hypothetical protein